MTKHLLAVACSLFLILHAPLALGQQGLCSNAQTLDLLKRVYRQSLDQFVARAGAPASMASDIDRVVPVQVRSIRTTRIDQAVARHHCEATLEAKLTAQGAEMVNNPVFQAGMAQEPELRGFQVRGAMVTHPVRYTVQLTDDKKEIYVQASGHENMADLVFNVAGREVIERMSQAPKPEAKPAPARQASAKTEETSTVEKTGLCKGLDRSITAENLECVGRMYEAADAELNKVYKELVAKLDKAQRSALLTSQRAWIKEKESKCEQEGEEFKGGSIAASIIAGCKVEMTQKRVQFLRAYKP